MKYILLFFLCIVLHNFKTQAALIKVLDLSSQKPLPIASVEFVACDSKAKTFSTAEKDGTIQNIVKTKSLIIVSCMGYSTFSDTIRPNQPLTIYLQPTTYTVDEVIVTGQIKPITTDQSIYKVNVINCQQIADKGANNLADLLANNIGMLTSYDPSLGTNLSIQGLSGEHVKILIDGVPVIGRQNGILDLSQISLANVDRVEIVEGPMSVVYGSNALAGAINIISRTSTKGSSLHAKINTYNETVGIYNFDGAITGRKGKHSMSLSGGRNFFAGYSADDTARSKQWKPKAQYFGNIGYKLSDTKKELDISTGYFKEELHNFGNLDKLYIKDLNKFHYIAFDEYHYTTRWNSKVGYLQKFDDDNQLQIMAAYSYYNKTKKTLSKDLATLGETLAAASDQDTTIFYNTLSRIVLNHEKKSWFNFQTGIEANLEKGTGKRLEGSKEIDDYAVFGIARLFSLNRINAQMGARLIQNSKFSAPLVYSLNLRYSPIPKLTLRASYGKGFRAPSLKELYLDFTDINHNVTGNDQLQAEYSNNFDGSVVTSRTLGKHKLTFDGTYFYNIVHNKIDFLYDSQDPTRAKYFNITSGNYTSKGVDLKLQYQYLQQMTFDWGIGYMGRSKTSDVHQFYYTTDYTIGFNYKDPKYMFRFSGFYKYTDKLFTSRAMYNENQVLKQVTEGYISAYQTIDLTLSRPFWKNRIDAGVGVKNLFNVKNVFSTGAGDSVHGTAGPGDTPIGWGRTWFARLSYNFGS
jgi:outer membrane receptor for ferrienterochelin and colicins